MGQWRRCRREAERGSPSRRAAASVGPARPTMLREYAEVVGTVQTRVTARFSRPGSHQVKVEEYYQARSTAAGQAEYFKRTESRNLAHGLRAVPKSARHRAGPPPEGITA